MLIENFAAAALDAESSKRNKKRVGIIVGIALGGVAAIVIVSSVFYLWWRKETPGHMRVHTDSPKKDLISH